MVVKFSSLMQGKVGIRFKANLDCPPEMAEIQGWTVLWGEVGQNVTVIIDKSYVS